MFNMGNTNVCKVLWHVRGARAGLGRTTTGAGTMLLCADPRLVSRMGAGATNTDILSRYLCISHHFPRPMKIPPKTKYHCRHSSLGGPLLCSALLCLLCGHREAKEQDISRSQVSSFQCSSWLHTVPYPNFLVLIFKLHTHAKTLKISTTGMVRTAVQHSRVVQHRESRGCGWAVRMLREVWRIFS